MSTAADGNARATAYLIDPMTAPEPSQETGPGSHFGSTFAPANQTVTNPPSTPSPRNSLGSNNPFRDSAGRRTPTTPPSKGGAAVSERRVSRSPRQPFPPYRAEAFGDYAPAPRSRSSNSGAAPPSYDVAVSANNSPVHRHRRRTSSLRERYPGDHSHEPLNMIRKDSKKADRSPHLNKRHQPGPDTIDRLDPAIGGRPYHHEGPFDAALLARNTSYESSPIAALQTSNAEALKATPQENIKDAVERHKPLDGVAEIPPGMPDRFGRTYEYQEGADLMHEENNDGPGYKRWAGKEYRPDDLKGQSEPAYSLDRAMQDHTITDSGIELAERNPAETSTGVTRGSSLRDGLKKRIGSLRKKNKET